MQYIKRWTLILTMMPVFILAACSSSGEEASNEVGRSESANPKAAESANKVEEAKDPIHLTMTSMKSSSSLQEFETYVKPFVEEKFPHITIEWVDSSIDEQITGGGVADIIATGYSHIPELSEKDVPLDLNDLVKKYNFNLDQYIPEALHAVSIYSGEDFLYALPYDQNYFGLFYNKDIFDRFGAEYPLDGMTWNETIELARQVTRSEDGMDFAGLQVNTYTTFARGLALTLVDPETDQAVLNTDGWLRAVETLNNIYSIPGNPFLGKHRVNFVQGTTAMLAYWGGSALQMILDEANQGLNWDVATYPHFEGMDGNIEITVNAYVISKVSEHADEAFEVITYLTTAPEIQDFKARQSMMPAVAFDGIESIFGQDVEGMQGKNVSAFFKTPALNNHMPSQYDSYAVSAANKYIGQYINGEISDARTALLRAEEEANQNITANKQ